MKCTFDAKYSVSCLQFVRVSYERQQNDFIFQSRRYAFYVSIFDQLSVSVFSPPRTEKKEPLSHLCRSLSSFFFFLYLTRRKAKYKCVHPANAIVHGNSCAYSTLCIPVAKTSTKQRHLFNRNAPPFLAVNDLK